MSDVSPVDEQARVEFDRAKPKGLARGLWIMGREQGDCWTWFKAGWDRALAAARPVPEGVTHAPVAGAEDAGHESATVCGSLPLDEPSADLARVDCLLCLRFLAAAAVSPVPEDAGDERQPDALAEADGAMLAILAAETGAGRLPGSRGIAECAVDSAVVYLHRRGLLTTEKRGELERRGSLGENARAALAAVPSVAQAPTSATEGDRAAQEEAIARRVWIAVWGAEGRDTTEAEFRKWWAGYAIRGVAGDVAIADLLEPGRASTETEGAREAVAQVLAAHFTADELDDDVAREIAAEVLAALSGSPVTGTEEER